MSSIKKHILTEAGSAKKPHQTLGEKRSKSSKIGIYKAIYSQIQTITSTLSRLITKALGGSKFNLAVRALDQSASMEEISEIRDLLDVVEKSKE